MKKIIALLFPVLFFSIPTTAFCKDLRTLDKQQRMDYLSALAIEVTKNFGPEWYAQGATKVVVSDSLATYQAADESRRKIKENAGRKYYRVTLMYDEDTHKRIGYSYASFVDIWADDGEPLGVIFGNSYGRNFIFLSYKEWMKMGIDKVDQISYEAFDTENIL